MISASVFECYKEQSIKAGCNDFLPKPVRAEDLLKQLSKYLKLKWIYDDDEGELPPEKDDSTVPKNKPKFCLI